MAAVSPAGSILFKYMQPAHRNPNQRLLTRATCLVVVLVALLAVLLWTYNSALLTYLAHEDGVFENVEAVNYLAAAGALFYVAYAMRMRNIWVLGVALMFFMAGGEEISWGQRLLGIATPDGLKAVNVQGETNLHNLEAVNGSIRAVSLVILWGLFVVIPVATFYAPTKELVRKLGLPIASWGSTLAIVVATIFMAVPRARGLVIFDLDEVGELLVSVAAVGLGIDLLMGARSGSAQT